MSRPVVGWFLIVVGLGAVVGGIGMGYINWLVDQTEREQVQWSDVHYGGARRPTRDPIPGYVSALVSVAVGGVIVRVGLGLRRLRPPVRRIAADGASRVCPDCGERTPARATRCYHCTGVIHEPVFRGGRGTGFRRARVQPPSPPVPPGPIDSSSIPLPVAVAPPAVVEATEMADYAARFATPADDADAEPTPLASRQASDRRPDDTNPSATPPDRRPVSPGLIAGR